MLLDLIDDNSTLVAVKQAEQTDVFFATKAYFLRKFSIMSASCLFLKYQTIIFYIIMMWYLDNFLPLTLFHQNISLVPGKYWPLRSISICFFVYGFIQWETTLLWKVASYWLSPYTELFLYRDASASHALYNEFTERHLHPSPKVMADFFQAQKLTWCPYPIFTILVGA